MADISGDIVNIGARILNETVSQINIIADSISISPNTVITGGFVEEYVDNLIMNNISNTSQYLLRLHILKMGSTITLTVYSPNVSLPSQTTGSTPSIQLTGTGMPFGRAIPLRFLPANGNILSFNLNVRYTPFTATGPFDFNFLFKCLDDGDSAISLPNYVYNRALNTVRQVAPLFSSGDVFSINFSTITYVI